MPDQRHPLELDASALRWTCDPTQLEGASSDDIASCSDIIGQERALKAIRLGLAVDKAGYNLFITGLTGTGRSTTIKCLIEQLDGRAEVPSDLLYLHNFRDQDKPRSLSLPAGSGRRLRSSMQEMVTSLQSAIPEVFETEEYQRRQKELVERYRDEERSLTRALEREVESERFQLVQIQLGPITRTDILPLIDDKPVSFDELESKVDRQDFPRSRFDSLRERHSSLTARLQETLKRARKLQRDFKQETRQLDDAMIRPVVAQVIGELKQEHPHPEVADYFDQVLEHILDHPALFRAEPETPQLPFVGKPDQDLKELYGVNLVVDNSATRGAPVITETSPTYKNLFGTIERLWDRQGGIRPNFSSIKAGSFLRASGGYLILNAFDVLSEPFAWPTLKRSLRNGVVEIEGAEPMLALATSGLKPEPFPARTKVILIGDRWVHQLLWAVDPDFKKIFKVRAEFDQVMTLEEGQRQSYVGLLAKLVRDEQLLPFSNDALAAVLEVSARMAGRQGKLTTEFNALIDVLREADFEAREASAARVEATHVQKAIDERRNRLGLIEDKLLEMVDDEALLISTNGATVGQINGLAVLSVGDYVFGKPVRISTTVGLGRAGIVNIEREAKLGGRTHNKGVLILGGFLQGRFGRDKPMTLSARIAFEQSYDGIDGDSASSTELYALLSALSDLPLRQDLAVTGSVNQRGQVQVIGGVNQKIEGFFDVCRQRGLSGTQGVLIPQGNTKDLMLRHDVVAAVRAGQFHVYAIASIDDGIELLTGTPAGTPDVDGHYPEDSVNRRVDDRLHEMALRLAQFGDHLPPSGDGPA